MLDNKPQPTSLDAPIPGQSLTAPLGERPWQNPPRYSTVEQAMGIPVDTVVDTIQLGGVMEGVHSVDVGILVSPILAEAVEQMAIAAGVDYVLEGKETNDDAPTDSEIALAMRDAAKETGMTLSKETTEETETPMEATPEPTGLMARRA
jgi:hypothetical protein